jgi:hypothetical protein
MVANGRITAAERAGIAEEADRVTALLNGDDRWWSCWDEWCPQKAAEL